VSRLRDALNELRDIQDRPGLWTDGVPPRIVNATLETLSAIANAVGEGLHNARANLREPARRCSNSQRNSRHVVDGIPGLVAMLTAAGELEFVNQQIVGYTGRTLEELKQWATSDTVHPDDVLTPPGSPRSRSCACLGSGHRRGDRRPESDQAL